MCARQQRVKQGVVPLWQGPKTSLLMLLRRHILMATYPVNNRALAIVSISFLLMLRIPNISRIPGNMDGHRGGADFHLAALQTTAVVSSSQTSGPRARERGENRRVAHHCDLQHKTPTTCGLMLTMSTRHFSFRATAGPRTAICTTLPAVSTTNSSLHTTLKSSRASEPRSVRTQCRPSIQIP